eukprot:137513-Hanusia_phi.AAC.1
MLFPPALPSSSQAAIVPARFSKVPFAPPVESERVDSCRQRELFSAELYFMPSGKGPQHHVQSDALQSCARKTSMPLSLFLASKDRCVLAAAQARSDVRGK